MPLSFEPDRLIMESLKNIQSKLGMLYAKIQGLSEAEKEYIKKQAFISNIGSSTRIENALLTDEEIEWIDTTLSEDSRPTAYDKSKKMILDKISKDKERSIEEVVGCREMLELVYSNYNELKPLRESDLRGLHQHLLRHFPKAKHYCGRYKPNTNQVVMLDHATGERTIVLDPASPGPITDAAMRDLLEWYKQALEECPWTLLIASEFTFRFLAIHPFQDGNGRISRGLFLLILLQSEDKYISEVSKYIAIDRHIEQNRSAYYLALRQGSDGKFKQDARKYNLEPISNFLIRIFDKALGDIEVFSKKYHKLSSLTDTERRILATFKASPEKKLQVSEIEVATNLNKRNIQKSIKKLVENGFLQKLSRGPQTKYRLVF
jgi:Fic family protein